MSESKQCGQPGYVNLEAENEDVRPLTEVDEVVLEHMPEEDKRVLDAKAHDTGFGQEPEVVIDTSGDRMAKYEDCAS